MATAVQRNTTRDSATKKAPSGGRPAAEETPERTDGARLSRELKFAITLHDGRRGNVVASLVAGDQLEFSVIGVEWGVKLPLLDLFWKALGTQGRKHGLLPRALKGAKIRKRRITDSEYARRYGVSRGLITAWRVAGAPLNDPDKMGDYIHRAREKAGVV